MKSFVLIFFWLFSTLSSTWVGAMTPEIKKTPMKMSMGDSMGHQNPERLAQLSSKQLSVEKDPSSQVHDCCPPGAMHSSMDMSASNDKTSSHSDCPYCGDNCQCEMKCPATLHVAFLMSHPFSIYFETHSTHQALEESAVFVPASVLERPPQTL